MSERLGARGRFPLPISVRLSRYEVDPETGCWEWLGAKTPSGYPRISVGSIVDGTAVMRQAHRVMYEEKVGPIPEGYEIDHLCTNSACVNPEHLEPVTPTENRQRVRLRNLTCGKGHAWTPENTLALASGQRACRECRRQLNRASYLRRRAKEQLNV